MGTVNAVCGRLVSEFAMELGRSPASEVIPEESLAAVFATAADEAIAAVAPALNQLSDVLGLTDRDVDWRSQVFRIVELARSNGIGPDRFANCAERSAEGLLELLPDAGPESAADLDARPPARDRTCDRRRRGGQAQIGQHRRDGRAHGRGGDPPSRRRDPLVAVGQAIQA